MQMTSSLALPPSVVQLHVREKGKKASSCFCRLTLNHYCCLLGVCLTDWLSACWGVYALPQPHLDHTITTLTFQFCLLTLQQLHKPSPTPTLPWHFQAVSYMWTQSRAKVMAVMMAKKEGIFWDEANQWNVWNHICLSVLTAQQLPLPNVAQWNSGVK